MHLSQRNLGRMLRMPLPELVFRGKQETLKLVDRVRPARASAARPHSNRLARFLMNGEKHFFPGVFDTRVPEVLPLEDSQSVLVAAQRALANRFDLLGYQGLEFGEPVDWHLDAVAGRRAPRVHWSRLNPLDASAVGDSKVVWELNRHQWLVKLGQAWRLTRDEKYPNALIQSIRAWLRDNPTSIGINWASSLELAFRLIAWCWALLLIRDSHVLTTEAFTEIERSIEEHATHIARYLSLYFAPNTHLTGEALGLLYAGILFPDMKHAGRWRRQGTEILVQEIKRQVLPDGVYMERSTCYQRYTADIYLHFMILASRAGIDVPAIVRDRLKSLLDVLVALRQPDGTMPNIGDADGGMLMPLSSASPDDYRATFSTAAVVFEDPVFTWAAGRVAPDTLWLLGTRGVEVFEKNEKRAPQEKTTQVFPSGGFVAMRSGWDETSHALIFDAGPLGCQYSAGHGHASLLSIQCAAFGEPFLVDAGTCCYTADRQLRDYFRSTTAHSTIVIDGESQVEPAGPFAWRQRCDARLLRWKVDKNVVFAEGFNDAYGRLSDPVKHTRRILFVNSRYWIVIDDLCGRATHGIDLRYQFAPSQLRLEGPWARATRNGEKGLLLRTFSIAPLEISLRQGKRHPMEGWISSNYGVMEPAPALVYSANVRLPIRILTLLWPFENRDEHPDVEAIHDAKGRIAGLSLSGSETVTFNDDEVFVA